LLLGASTDARATALGGKRWRYRPASGRAPTWFRGLDQFHVRGDTDGVGYCIAEAKPYALEFSNTADVICLLLGDISSSSTKFEDDCEKPLIF
jgi:AraC family transcriptional regulator